MHSFYPKRSTEPLPLFFRHQAFMPHTIRQGIQIVIQKQPIPFLSPKNPGTPKPGWPPTCDPVIKFYFPPCSQSEVAAAEESEARVALLDPEKVRELKDDLDSARAQLNAGAEAEQVRQLEVGELQRLRNELAERLSLLEQVNLKANPTVKLDFDFGKVN